MEERNTKAIKLFEYILFQSIEQRTFTRIKHHTELWNDLVKAGHHCENLQEVQDFIDGKKSKGYTKFLNMTFRDMVGDFVFRESEWSRVEVPIPFPIFSEQSRKYLINENPSEKELEELFHSITPHEQLGPYMFIGITKMKNVPWAGSGRHEVAVWRDVINPNALAE